uniref:Uncharacterized protein n=1 Tax=Rhizophora mucronata TaxID=61149 RepID=A0A2P2KQ00_RHIMU
MIPKLNGQILTVCIFPFLRMDGNYFQNDLVRDIKIHYG